MHTQGKCVVKQALYLLKKRWGVAVEWYKYLASTFDVETGAKSVDWDVAKIRRGILLPREKARLSAGVSATPFNYGGYFDGDKRTLIIDIRDIPRDWNIIETDEEINDKIIIANERYQIHKLDKYELGLGYILTLEHVVGSEPDARIDTKASNTIMLGDSV